MKITAVFTILFFMFFSFASNSQNFQTIADKKTDWVLTDLLNNQLTDVEIQGNPQIINSPYGAAVSFDGIDDALFLKEMPLNGLESFTVEMIFKPEADAPFEQRVLHIGEISADRMLLEIRAVDSNWYFDGYAVSGGNKLALANEELVHPLGQWYHVAFAVTPDSLTTYVNGRQELHEAYTFKPIEHGRTSIGVRMNKVSWFKGAVYKIRISAGELKPNQFLTF